MGGRVREAVEIPAGDIGQGRIGDQPDGRADALLDRNGRREPVLPHAAGVHQMRWVQGVDRDPAARRRTPGRGHQARAEQALSAARSAALRDAAGVTVAQYAALSALADDPGIPGAAPARACLVTPQAMAAVLKHLEECGLVVRTAHRWHRKMLETRLTDAGRGALRLADEQAVRIERRLAEEFAPEERDALRALLARCVTAIGRD
ncbi:DNA-binding transcriptional regulator, MarR family [Streptomyces atratus]|uniref:DNA-binding transcriptional regulator, MarR family n=2 Tax=Streptomyces atratus TaxID=1893 RepID=A0A1K1ZAX2_STRAR|nr:DNA-binding transcriptional regulator, MarR family [Streptomyces atratus]